MVEFTSDSDSADDCLADNEEEKPNCSSAVLTEQTDPDGKKKKTNPKTDAIPTSAYFVANKYSISNTALTELAAAFTTIDGKNVEGLNLSVNTTRRRKRTLHCL